MRAAILCLMLFMATPLQANAEVADDWEKAQASVNELVDTCLKVDWETACIGRAALTCFVTELAPFKPHSFLESLAPKPLSQIEDWCDQAERNAWQTRLNRDIQLIKELLPNGPAQRDFEEQQRAWETFFAKPSPRSRSGTESFFLESENEFIPLVAVRSLQVEGFLDDIRNCENDVFGVDASFCKYLKTTP